MDQVVQPSEAAFGVQENGGEKPVSGLPAATSEATGEAQEQQHGNISPDEERRRQEQSMRDRIRHEERLRVQREIEMARAREEAAKEQQMLAELDDEDYGRVMREKAAKQQQEQASLNVARQRLAVAFEQMKNDVLSQVSDQAARDDLARRVSANEFATFKDFYAAAMKAETQAQAERLAKRREKDIREATRNELRADEIGSLVPQLGAGLPTAALNPDKLSAQQKMALGYAQALKRKRGG